MRYQITLASQSTVRVPVDHGKQMRSALYAILEAGDPAFAKWLRTAGYWQDGKVFHMFGLSGLRAPYSQRRIENAELLIAPGTMVWHFSSPMQEVLDAFASGIDRTAAIELEGNVLDISEVAECPFPVEWEQLPAEPNGARRYRCTCFSPIVAETRRDSGRYFLEHLDGEFAGHLYDDIAQKYRIVTGEYLASLTFRTTWSKSYLMRSRNHGRKRVLIDPKSGFYVIGHMAPFTLHTTEEIMRIAYSLGLGDYNSLGMGMIAPAEEPVHITSKFGR